MLIGITVLQAILLGLLIARGKETISSAILMLLPMTLVLGASFGFSPLAKAKLIGAAQTADPNLIGHLCEALGSGDQDLMAIARSALVDLFPLLDEGSEPLDRVQFNALVHYVAIADATKDYEFLASALRALSILGRQDAIPLLERYRDNEAPAYARARGAALAALPDLRMRLAKQTIQESIEKLDAARELTTH